MGGGGGGVTNAKETQTMRERSPLYFKTFEFYTRTFLIKNFIFKIIKRVRIKVSKKVTT